MRRRIGISVLSLLLAFSMVIIVQAQALTGTGWYSTATIQNVGSGQATVNLAVYQRLTPTPSTATFQLGSGASRVFVAGGNNAHGTVDVSPSLGFGSGAAVISSDQPVVAIGSIQNNELSAFPGLGVNNGNATGFFRGSSQASTSLFYPVVKNNFAGRTTVFSIQAAGSDAYITATIRSNSGSLHTFTTPITANHSVFLIPGEFTPPMANANCGDVNTSPCFGALTVTSSSGPIVGAYMEFNTGESPAQLVLAASMFTETEADNKIYCPVFKHNYPSSSPRFTGITVINTSNSPVNVRVTYKVFAGSNSSVVGSTYNSPPVSIPAKGSIVFSQFNNNIGGMPAGSMAAATIELLNSTDNVLMGVVNESNIPSPLNGNRVRATAYTCFGEESATNRIAAPLFKRNVAGVTSGLVVQNVGASPAQMTATFKCGTINPPPVITHPIPAGESFSFSGFPGAQYMDNIPFGQNCAVTVTVPSGGKIVGIAQETGEFGTTQRNLDTKNYEAFNLPNT